MASIVLDTHVLVWWVQSPERLSPRAAAAIDDATRLCVSSITFWEISLLVRKKRLDLGLPIESWVENVCAIDRLMPIPLTAHAALSADLLPMHPDPADRFIVATARQEAAPLVSCDQMIRDLAIVETIW